MITAELLHEWVGITKDLCTLIILPLITSVFPIAIYGLIQTVRGLNK